MGAFAEVKYSCTWPCRDSSSRSSGLVELLGDSIRAKMGRMEVNVKRRKFDRRKLMWIEVKSQRLVPNHKIRQEPDPEAFLSVFSL